MLSLEKPEIFSPKFEIVSCFVQYKDEILLLLRQDHKPEPNTYGVPAGKVDKGIDKDIDEAMTREWREETQLDLSDAAYLMKTYVQYPWYDFIYHMYLKKFQEKPNVIINPEEHKWFTREKISDALKKDLIQDLNECIRLVYNVEKEKEHNRTLNFDGLDYNDRRELVDDIQNEMFDIIIEENIHRWNALAMLFKEILKNSADHTDGKADISFKTTKKDNKMEVYFSIQDEWPWINFGDESINDIFWTKWIKDREKKGKLNFGIGLWMIKNIAEVLNIDLIVHNHWKVYHINNLWLQENSEPKEKFGYEWIWTFQIEE